MTVEELQPRFKVIADIKSEKYSICDEGYVINNITGRKIKPYINKKINGYVYVKLQDPNAHNKKKQRSFHVGVLVGKAFISNPLNKKTVNHEDGNKLNNHYTNIKWNTHKENSEHAFRVGLGKSGLQHYNSRFSIEDIFEIRQLAKQGVKRFEIARYYNVSETAIDNLCKRKTYKNFMSPQFNIMNPRFKVGKPYPFSTYTQGSIITTGVNSKLYKVFKLFPENFIELHWWEERKVEDMPEYVKIIDENVIAKVEAHSIGIGFAYKETDYFTTEYPRRKVYSTNTIPSTEQEYNDYINSKSNAKP